MTFQAACLVFAALLGGHAVLCAWAVRRWPDLWRQFPRERLVGGLLGALGLAWSAHEATYLLEGGLLRFTVILWILVPVVAILAFFFLEFLLARAICGLLLLLIPLLLHEAFVRHLPWRPAFSTLLYAVGLAAIYVLAVPWRYRDWLERCKESAPARAVSGLLAGLAALAVAAAGLLA
ncbi:MAG: hypothetical protein WC789_12870 [Lentisphaeria bacterium]